MRAASLKRRELAWTAGALLLVLALCCVWFHSRPASLRAATFNIENFPRDARQVRGAFDALGALDAQIVGVQEITDPGRFADEAVARLGPAWRFVADDAGLEQRVGVLWDGDRYALAYARTHDDTQVDGRGKPVLEVRLRRRGGGRAVRVFVVHLKAGGDYAHVRREQLRRLAPRIEDAAGGWDDVVLLGDFNATGAEDRATLARFARQTGLVWATEELECTSYWSRRDGCVGSALDHVLTRRRPAGARARGPCETEGCATRDRCPAFHREVSDHCPVTIDL